MGQYLKMSLCHRFTLEKSELEEKNISLEDAKRILSEEVEISYFNLSENNEHYIFTIDNKLFSGENIYNFINTQCGYLYKEDMCKLKENLDKLDTYDAIVTYAKQKPHFCFQENDGWYIMRTSRFSSFSVKIENIVYFIEGKAYLECYSDLFSYIKSLIIKSSNNELGNVVKIFLD